MRVRLAAIVIVGLACGCDSVFSVDHVAGLDAPDAASDICIDDDFAAPLDTSRWTVAGENNGLVIYTDSGLLHIDVPEEVSSTQNLFGGIHTGLRNLIGASTEIEVTQVADSTQPSTVGLLLALDGTNQYRLVISKAQVLAIRIIATATTDLQTAPYDPAKHRFLRIRHDLDMGQLLFETRGATTDYVVFAQVPLELDFVKIDSWLYAQSYNSMAAAFSAQFEQVLVTGPSCH